uniref:Uncharacterized protein n=1 Tax=viral metagenome TaxID=1070528 RepID=A0A6M3L4U0_9ZZZZ
MAKKDADLKNTIPQDDNDEFQARFGNKLTEKQSHKSPMALISGEESVMGVKDEDEIKSMSEIARGLFNFPADKILSWSRWQPWEIPKIAATIVRSVANSPNRPKNPDGTLKRLSVIYIEATAWLRLAEKGAMRTEAMQALRAPTSDQMTMGADAWRDNP